MRPRSFLPFELLPLQPAQVEDVIRGGGSSHMSSSGSRGGIVIDVNQMPCSTSSDDDPENSCTEAAAAPPTLRLSGRGSGAGFNYDGVHERDLSMTMKASTSDGGGKDHQYEALWCSLPGGRGGVSDDDEESGGGASARKKLRLSKEQSALLEESFKQHSTLNPKKKNALAKQLNLRPRQVEVWFQNRRARTKLKQTEVDFEVLKKCFETLTEENRRLHKEVAELRALKKASPSSCTLDCVPATTLTMCPSCERLTPPRLIPAVVAPNPPNVFEFPLHHFPHHSSSPASSVSQHHHRPHSSAAC